jgi:hypothetical protein
MRARVAALVALALLSLPVTLLAQAQVCEDTDSIDRCAGRISERLTATSGGESGKTEAVLQDQQAEVERKPTGVSDVGNRLISAISDYLPALAGAIGFTPIETEQGAAGLETNLRIPVGASLQRLRFQTILREPEIYEPLRAALPEANREERTAALTRELGDFDDIRLGLAWNMESGAFGRTFESYRPVVANLFDLELAQFSQRPGVNDEKARLDREMQRAYRNAFTGIKQSDVRTDQGCSFDSLDIGALQLRCLQPDARDRLVEVIDRAVRAAEAVEAELDDQLERTGFYDLADLVNNQPQLSLQLNVELRSDLAGPNEVSGVVRYETGFANVNGLRRACASGAESDVSVECLRDYARSPGQQASLQRGDRFFVSVSYAHRQDYAVAIAEDDVTLDLPGTWDLAGELGFGRYVAFKRNGEQVGRIDLSAQYVHHEDDPERQSRFVGSATYTQRVSESMSLAAGVSYASRPEFLEEVDHKVSANFGLRYKLIHD